MEIRSGNNSLTTRKKKKKIQNNMNRSNSKSFAEKGNENLERVND